MIYYLIRHKATGEFMPELKRTRGYSHWNPSKLETINGLSKKLLGTPRLFRSIKHSRNAINQWNAMPNATFGYKPNYFGEEDYDVNIEPDGRSKDDLEIIDVNIEEVKTIASYITKEKKNGRT